MCTLIEKMANRRLSWFFEANGHMNEEEYGFRKNRSTVDCLKKNTLLLSRLTLRRHMTPPGVTKFFSTFRDSQSKKICFSSSKTSWQTEISELRLEENGVVQGAVLSVNLFLLALMDIRDPVTMAGYADDWTTFVKHSDFEFIQKELKCTVKK
jgi:hypothetical protein